MARDTLNIPSRTIPASELILGPLTVGEARQTIRVELDCTQHLNAGVLLTLTFEVSYDAGDTWQHVTSLSRPGGVLFGEGGLVENMIFFEMHLQPEREAIRRRVRCKVSLTGGSFVTSGGRIEVSD